MERRRLLLAVASCCLLLPCETSPDEDREEKEDKSGVFMARALARKTNESALSKFLTEPELGTSW